METIQQQLNALQTSVQRQRLLNIALLGIIVAGGFIAAVRPVGDATFDKITCKSWTVIDKYGKKRISAETNTDKYINVAEMMMFDKDEKRRIRMSVLNATIDLKDGDILIDDSRLDWIDNSGKIRVSAGTFGNRSAGVSWFDKDGQGRLLAVTNPDGTLTLPTKESAFSTQKKP